MDLSQLCITEREAAWVLYVDLVCLEFDGNAFALPLTAAVEALAATVLPEAREGERERQRQRSEPIPSSSFYSLTPDNKGAAMRCDSTSRYVDKACSGCEHTDRRRRSRFVVFIWGLG